MIAFRLNRKSRIALTVIAALGALIGAGFVLRFTAERRLASFLTGHGIGQAMVLPRGGAFGGGSLVLTDIRLDPDGDSTIGDIRAIIRWPFLWSSRPFSRVIIDHLILAGTMDEDGYPAISGLKPGPLAPLVEADNVLLNSGRLDLATPAGDLQFSLKGDAARQADGTYRANGAFWGSQRQATLDTRWQGATRPDGGWTAAADVRELRGDLGHLAWSRVSGWLKIDGDRTGPLAAAGALAAGQLRLGNRTALADASLILDGPVNDWHLILKGAVPAWPGMTALCEARGTAGRLTLHADVAGRSAADLIGFLEGLGSDFNLALPRSTLLTPLLLTKGNLNRLRGQVAGLKNVSSAELVLDGLAENIDGRLVIHHPSGRPDESIALRPAHL